MEENNDGDFTTADWINAEVEEFDLSKEFEEQIFPKVKEIEAICLKLGMPFHTRFFFEQSKNGNSSSTVSWLGGPGRATPEILALTLLNQMTHETPMDIAGLMQAAVEKFSDGDTHSGIIMPL